MSALSRIKDGVVLRVAASELSGTLPMMKVSDNLTFLAEVMIEQAVAVARAELVQRYGEPQQRQAGFAVMAYGKLGGIELSYGSDLDLVFVFDGAEGKLPALKSSITAAFYTATGPAGGPCVIGADVLGKALRESIFACDQTVIRAWLPRPSPRFRRYQLESAWTWEHQALVRSRTVAGDATLKARWRGLRCEVLALPREQTDLAQQACGNAAENAASRAR